MGTTMNLEQIENKAEANSVAYLTPELVDYYWPSIEQALDADPSLWDTMFTKQNIRDRIHSTEIQVWVVFNGSVISLVFFTQRYVAPNGIATLQIFWMFGTGLKDAVFALEGTIDKFAATLNCQRIEVVGRPGFLRLLAPLGAQFQAMICSRPVRTVREN